MRATPKEIKSLKEFVDNMKLKENAMSKVKGLMESPMLYLSGGSKELFHSNFLYWLGVNYRDAFQQTMTKLHNINATWPEGWEVKREYKHLDLCVTYLKDTGKMRNGESVKKECAFIILENKVKSLPERTQLKRYEKMFEGYNQGCSYAVLSLVKKFPGSKYLDENTCWQLHHYDELADVISKYCTADIRKEHHIYISDYCAYVRELSKLAEGWKVEEDDTFLAQEEGLAELRLNDIYEKVRYAQIAAMLAEKMKSLLESVASEEENVVLGMSNADVILRREHKDAEEILAFYGCPEAKPFQQVFIGSGMSHGIGLFEAKVKVSNDCCLVLQVQGNRYCHGIEKQNIVHNSTSLSEWLRNFIDFKFGGLLDHKSQPDSKQCQYKDGFLYKSQKIEPNFKVRHIVDAMKNDLEIILKAKLNPKMPTTT